MDPNPWSCISSRCHILNGAQSLNFELPAKLLLNQRKLKIVVYRQKKHQKDNKEPQRNKDGLSWRRLPLIANDTNRYGAFKHLDRQRGQRA